MYTFASADAQQAVFRRRDGRLGGWILIVLGAPFFVALIFGFPPKSFPLSAVLVWLSFGVFLIASGLSALTYWVPPERLVLDAGAGEARFMSSGSVLASIPLHHYSGVSSYSRFVKRGDNTIERHYIELRQHDGSSLTVHSTESIDERDRMRAQLEALLKASPAGAPLAAPPKLPNAFSLRTTGTTRVVEWPTSVGLGPLLSSLLLLTAALMMEVGVLLLAFGEQNQTPVGLFILAAILSIAVILTLLNAIKRLGAIGRRNRLTLTADAVEYSTLGGLLPKSGWSLGYDSVHSVGLDVGRGELCWNISHAAPEPPSAEPAAPLGYSRQTAENDVAAASAAAAGARRIFVGDFPLGPLVALDQWLQVELSRRSGRELR